MLRQHGYGFGIRIGDRIQTIACKFDPQLAEVLDDTVVHHGDGACAVGVGVVCVRLAVGGPAGVADARLTRQRLMHQQIAQIDQFAHRTAAVQRAIVHCGDARTVIAAILESFQTVQDDWGGL